MEKQRPQTLEYNRLVKVPPYSGRAIACFVFAILGISSLISPQLFWSGGAWIFVTPIAELFSIVYGVMAFGQFPDDRSVMYRGRWMAITGLLIAIVTIASSPLWRPL